DTRTFEGDRHAGHERLARDGGAGERRSDGHDAQQRENGTEQLPRAKNPPPAWRRFGGEAHCKRSLRCLNRESIWGRIAVVRARRVPAVEPKPTRFRSGSRTARWAVRA